jgi:hypothetical protein
MRSFKLTAFTGILLFVASLLLTTARDYAFAAEGVMVRDHRSKPIVRDHRSPQGVMVRDHRSKPIVRDHRSPQGVTVRDHRSGAATASSPGGVTVTQKGGTVRGDVYVRVPGVGKVRVPGL